MKSVNWATIPQRLIKNTVFADMDLAKLGIDYEHIESLFCSKPIVIEKKSVRGIFPYFSLFYHFLLENFRRSF